MTARNDFNGVISDWLDEQAGRGAPDYLDEILTRTTRTRQRPAWSSLERWLPMQTTLRLAPVPRIAWLLVVVALIAAFAAAVLVVGSRQRHLPPPFGPARNGAILYGGSDNDIHTLDAVTGAVSTLIAGPSDDSVPWLSPDGTRFLFLRDAARNPATDGQAGTIMVANVDGTNVRPLTSPVTNLYDAAWSHDGARIAVSSDIAGTSALQVFTVDGSTQPLVIDTGQLTTEFLAFRPGDRELTFRGSTGSGDGLYAVGVDGRGLRTIAANIARRTSLNASLSPDGMTIADSVWDDAVRAGSIRLVEVGTGRDVTPAFAPASGGVVIDEGPVWSPDGSLLLFVRYHGSSVKHLAVVPAHGGRVLEIGPGMQTNNLDSAQFSPDGLQVIAYYAADASTWLLDPTGSLPDRKLTAQIAERAAWQRLAP